MALSSVRPYNPASLSGESGGPYHNFTTEARNEYRSRPKFALINVKILELIFTSLDLLLFTFYDAQGDAGGILR